VSLCKSFEKLCLYAHKKNIKLQRKLILYGWARFKDTKLKVRLFHKVINVLSVSASAYFMDDWACLHMFVWDILLLRLQMNTEKNFFLNWPIFIWLGLLIHSTNPCQEAFSGPTKTTDVINLIPLCMYVCCAKVGRKYCEVKLFVSNITETV
jgi:hypothetical protein